MDEVGEIPLELQGKLLRALQNRRFERLGEARTRAADVRFVAATNRDLEREMAAGRFRRDLYYRLSVFPIEVPPLRSRLDDVGPLAGHFLEALNATRARPALRLTEADVRHLTAYDWPGNVRELKNVIERAYILAKDGTLRLDDALSRSAVSFSGRLSPPGQDEARRGFFTAAEFAQLERQNLIGALEAA